MKKWIVIIILCACAVLGFRHFLLQPDLEEFREQAVKAGCNANQRLIGTGVEIFKASHERLPPQGMDVPSIMRAVELQMPLCSEEGKYTLLIRGDEYTVKCSVHGALVEDSKSE